MASARWGHRRFRNAALFDRGVAQVRVVDPHHALHGGCFPIVDRPSSRGPGLIIVRLPDGRERAIPRAATDLGSSTEASPAPASAQMHVSVRTLLPLANHVRAVLASRNEGSEIGTDAQLRSWRP